MRFGTWNVRTLCRAGSLTTFAKEMLKYKLDLVGVQEVRWDRGGNRGDTELAGEYTLFSGKGNKNHGLGTVFFGGYMRKSRHQLKG
jgi:exonuclease III